MKNKYTVTFRMDDREKSASFLLLGTFVLGPIYLLFFQMWGPALIFFLISLGIWIIALLISPVLLVLLILLPFCAEYLVRKWYLSNEWDEVLDESAPRQTKEKTTALERAQIAFLEAQTEAIKKASIPAIQTKKEPTTADEGVPPYKL